MMDKTLLEIFNNTKDWLKFAEAKNAMLVAFNAASIYGVTKLPYLDVNRELDFIKGYFIFTIILFVVSTTTCLISFVPRLNIINLSISSLNQDENIFFFENLRKKTPKQILESLKSKDPIYKQSKLDEDLALQIHSLARVASNKYGLFTIAVWITVSGYISLPLAGIFCLYNYLK